jgi:hypothetical protein
VFFSCVVLVTHGSSVSEYLEVPLNAVVGVQDCQDIATRSLVGLVGIVPGLLRKQTPTE